MLCLPGDNPGLGSAHELVATEAHKVSATFEHLPGRGLVMVITPVLSSLQYAAPKVFDKRHTLPFGKLSEFAPFRCGHKSIHEKIALMDL